MGAFFLYHKNASISKNLVNQVYYNKGFKKPLSINLGEYNLKLYRKQHVQVPNYYNKDANYIFVCGSLFYKGLGYQDSLKKLLEDYLNNRIDSQKLYGNYSILFHNEATKEIRFYIDPAFIKNIYFDPERKLISSDFLAILEAFPGKYTLNEIALIENLTTGCLISPDTYTNEIKKLDKVNYLTLEDFYPGIKVMYLKPEITYKIDTYEEAIAHANTQLSEYFKAVRNLTNEFGAHIGLTGGFDSRLLLMHARKHLENLITNSFWRKNSLEYSNAKKLAKAAKFDFFSFEETPFVKPVNKEMLKASYYYFDGQIRSQNSWEEEFNLSDYATQIASSHFVGFHGCGGEQYRNADRLIRKISFKKFILYEWMFKQSPNVYNDKEIQHQVYENIEKKLRRIVVFDKNKLGLRELKKIQNEVWNTANRCTRVNVINQQMFYFAPFTEYQISHSAYRYIPFLGRSLNFQINMMNRLDKKLSEVNTNYGFNIIKGEPFKYKLIPFIIYFLPKAFFYKIYFLVRHSQNNSLLYSEFGEKSHPYMNELGVKINLEKLSHNRNLGNSLNSFDFLLKNSGI